MKILVVQLLRYGDIFMSSGVLAGIKAKHPDAELHLLINEGFEGVSPLLPMVDKVITFPRKYLQESLADIHRPLFEAADSLKHWLSEVNKNHYELVVNITQNRLSGFICNLIRSDSQIGLTLNHRGQAGFGSSWLKYLNDVVGAGAESIFHHTDIFTRALNLKTEVAEFTFSETEKGRAEAQTFYSKVGYSSKPQIAIQALTSDDKKNWLTLNWVELIKQFKILEPTARFIFLAGPGEENQIQAIINQLSENNLQAESAVLSFAGAVSFLNTCDLLITVDTSIKHLACGTNVPILELCFGSSDPTKTGAYKNGSLIIQNAEHCSPCQHSSSCHREKRFCAQRVDGSMVGLAAYHYFRNDMCSLHTIAQEYEDQARLYLVDRLTNGFWYPEQLGSKDHLQIVKDSLDRLAWHFMLEKEHLKKIATFGSECVLLREQIEARRPSVSSRELLLTLQQAEVKSEKIESRINRILNELSHRLRLAGELEQVDFIDSEMLTEIKDIENESGLGQFLTEKVNIQKNSGLYRFRQLQMSLNEVFQFQQIKIKLLRNLQNQLVG